VAAAPVSRDSAGPPQRVQAGPRRGKRAGVWGRRDTLTGACRLRLGAPRAYKSRSGDDGDAVLHQSVPVIECEKSGIAAVRRRGGREGL
jgi:hypothetical protein